MIYTGLKNEVQILSVVDVDQQHVRCKITYQDGQWAIRTVAVFDLNATGGINEIMARIRELTGGTP